MSRTGRGHSFLGLGALLAPGLLLALTACKSGPLLGAQPQWPTPTRGAVVSEHPLATQVGLRVLERGGNAADAAVATAFALAVVYPQAGNLGGGGFALWVPHAEPGGSLAFDFRETAPRRLVPDLFLGEDGEPVRERSLSGHLAVGVPGSPLGLAELHARCGSLSWRDVLAPAIELAEGGFDVDPWLARDLRREPQRGRLLASAAARRLFYPGGEALAEGQRLRQPELAQTLRRIASDGARAFYSGDLARALAAEMRAHGGVLDEEDLRAYQVRVVQPLEGTFRGHRLVTMPPPSSGGVLLLQVLAILDGFPLDTERDAARERAGDSDDPDRAARLEAGLSELVLHWWIESLRAGFADRAQHLGDPEFHDVPLEALLSPRWIAERRTSIGERANPGILPWLRGDEATGGETTHLSVLDTDGNAVSLTTTLNSGFGCGVMVPGTGVLLNNEIDDFSIVAGVPNVYGLVGTQANQLEPRKRPLSSMTPTVVADPNGVVELVLGSPGGPRIISAVAEVMLRVLVHEQELADAILAPRIHQQWRPERTFLEPGWDESVIAALEARGHEFERADSPWASVQGIEVEPGAEPLAFSDPRRGGAGGVEGRGVAEPARPGSGHPGLGADRRAPLPATPDAQ